MIRQSVRDQLNNYIADAERVRKCERGIYNAAIKCAKIEDVYRDWKNSEFVGIYSCYAYKILGNLSNLVEGSAEFRRRLNEDDVDFELLPSICNRELVPDASRGEREMIELRRCQKLERKVSNDYVCPKCRGRRTTRYEYQGRAADEAATISITCLDCAHIWRK